MWLSYPAACLFLYGSVVSAIPRLIGDARNQANFLRMPWWQQTDATVGQSSIVFDAFVRARGDICDDRRKHALGRDTCAQYRPRITYYYVVNGRMYWNDRYTFYDKTAKQKRALRLITDQYREGQIIQIWYDPWNPQLSVISREINVLQVTVHIAFVLTVAGLLTCANLLLARGLFRTVRGMIRKTTARVSYEARDTQ